MGKIRQNDEAYKQMLAALQKNDLKGVEDLIANNNFKSTFASAVLNFTKIDYAKSNDLVVKALMFRINKLGAKKAGKSHHVASGSNVAVFEYIDLNGKIAYKEAIAAGNGAKNHAEKLITHELENMGIPKENVLRIYSELDACGGCTGLLKDFVNAKGFYSFEYNNKGVQMLGTKLNELYKFLNK